jgi:uncharacterized protein (TIGR00255 family)
MKRRVRGLQTADLFKTQQYSLPEGGGNKGIMAKSMTGYGRYELTRDGRRFTAEIKSVNNRYLDMNIRMPRQFNPFEASIRTIMKEYIVRGKVDIFISYEDEGETPQKIRFNKAIAGQYLTYMKEMADEFNLPMDVTVGRLSSYPDVFEVEEEDPDVSALQAPLEETVRGAAQQFLAAREKEGAFITKDLLDKLTAMEENVSFIESRAPQIVDAFEKKLRERISELLEGAEMDDARIAQEVAIYSDKVCIDEELVRLHSHIEATRAELSKDGESVGRKLDFLAQEMNREANTILSKTDDVISADRAIDLKTSIEKIREQIQNLE